MLRNLDRSTYTGILKRWLPKGVFYRNISRVGHPFEVLLHLAAQEFSRIHNRLVDTTEEFHPSTATETIEAWEAMAGIDTDGCVQRPDTLEARRALVQGRLQGELDNSTADYARIARAYGASGLRIKSTYGQETLAGHPLFGLTEGVAAPEWAAFCWSLYVDGCPLENRENLTCAFDKALPAGTVFEIIHNP